MKPNLEKFVDALTAQGLSTPAHMSSLTDDDLKDLSMLLKGERITFIKEAKKLPDVDSWLTLAPSVKPRGMTLIVCNKNSGYYIILCFLLNVLYQI